MPDSILVDPTEFDLIRDYLAGLIRAFDRGEVVRVELHRPTEWPDGTTYRYAVTLPTPLRDKPWGLAARRWV